MRTRYPKDWSDLSSGRGFGAVSFQELYYAVFSALAVYPLMLFIAAFVQTWGSESNVWEFLRAVVVGTFFITLFSFLVVVFFVVIVGAPVGYLVARAMRQVAPLWPHLLAFFGVGAFTGMVVIFVFQGLPWSPGMFGSGDGEYQWAIALQVIGTAALCAAFGRLVAAMATKRRRYISEHPTPRPADVTAEDW